MNQYSPFGFSNISFMVKNLLIINVIVFVAKIMLAGMGVDLVSQLGLNFGNPNFKWFQFITYMFMHGDFGHIFFNMFALWMFGSHIESMLGPKRFLIFYLLCGIGAAALHIGLEYYLLTSRGFNIAWFENTLYFVNAQNNALMLPPMVGASGSIYGILFAFGYFFPNLLISIYFIFPMKAKYLVAIMIAIELWMGMRNNPGDNVAHFAHLGGMLIAFILLKIWKIKYNRFS